MMFARLCAQAHAHAHTPPEGCVSSSAPVDPSTSVPGDAVRKSLLRRSDTCARTRREVGEEHVLRTPVL